MAVMATGNLLTRTDLDALPDDGLRHELIDGTFVTAPGFRHQAMVTALAAGLRSACAGTGLVVLVAPFDVALGPNVLEPDIIVARREAFTDRDLPAAPLLVVEVRSTSTGWIDDGRKRLIYQEHGVAHYWLADPVAPSLTILELQGGEYLENARANGDQNIEVHSPLVMVLNPADLAKG